MTPAERKRAYDREYVKRKKVKKPPVPAIYQIAWPELMTVICERGLKHRKCLKCCRSFKSMSIGIRICAKCKL